MTLKNDEIEYKLIKFYEKKKEEDFKNFLFDKFVPLSCYTKIESTGKDITIDIKTKLNVFKRKLSKLALISASYFVLDYIFNKYTGTNFKDYVPLINGNKLTTAITFCAYFVGTAYLLNKIKNMDTKNVENHIKFSKEADGYWYVEFKGKKLPEILTNSTFFDLIQSAKKKNLSYSLSFVDDNYQLINIHFKGDTITNSKQDQPALTVINNDEIKKFDIKNNVINNIITSPNVEFKINQNNSSAVSAQKLFNNSFKEGIEKLESQYGILIGRQTQETRNEHYSI